MELINATKMQAGYTLGMDPDGRERVVVVVKGTFTIPGVDKEPGLAAEQVPLVMADQFTGDPGFSATLYESDFPPFKPRCDVLLNGSAHAPGGRPVESIPVSLRVGALKKSFRVVGNRVWRESLLFVRPGPPEAFTRMPISYDRAFGGMDQDMKRPNDKKAYMANPIGVGYYPLSKGRVLIGKRLPNTEEIDRPVKTTKGPYNPLSFGAISRNFQSRIRYAGTYDQNWLDNVFPFLPSDFDPRYYQAAPPDQQMDYPKGGEEVELINLTPEGRTRFRLPSIEIPVEFTNASYDRKETMALLDTIIIEPDQRRFLLLWRASLPLKRNIFEAVQAVVGRMPRGWYRARALGKTYYPSLRDIPSTQPAETVG
jgi:hypothetical protein